MRTTPLLIVTAALLTGACGNQAATNPPVTTPRAHTATHPQSRSHTTSSTAATTTMTHTSSRAPLRALQTFAGAYGAYLDGRVPPATLPDATAAARGEVGPPIPAPRRAGTLALVAISQIAGGPSYIVSHRDREHTFGASSRSPPPPPGGRSAPFRRPISTRSSAPQRRRSRRRPGPPTRSTPRARS